MIPCALTIFPYKEYILNQNFKRNYSENFNSKFFSNIKTEYKNMKISCRIEMFSISYNILTASISDRTFFYIFIFDF